MNEIEVFDAISRLGGLVVLAGGLLTGVVMTKFHHENVMKERDKADALRDARLEDQKSVNVELTATVKDLSEALRRIADAWEARNRAEADKR